MKIAEIDQLITDNLADFSNIIPEKHRAVSSALLAYISTLPRTKVLTLENPVLDRNFSLITNLEETETIIGAYAMLECNVANNGFSVGDTVTAPTPYPGDSGRTAQQGLGLQYSNINNSTVKVLIGDQLHVMKPYSALTNALADTVVINVVQWKLVVFLNYR